MQLGQQEQHSIQKPFKIKKQYNVSYTVTELGANELIFVNISQNIFKYAFKIVNLAPTTQHTIVVKVSSIPDCMCWMITPENV